MRSPFLFIAGNKPWVCALASALGHEVPVHATTTCDWRIAWKNHPQWPNPSEGSDITFTTKVLPTGYNGVLRPLANPFMRYTVRKWYDTLIEKSQSNEAWVVTTRPFTTPWLASIPNSQIIYYNLDDYTLYRPQRADRVKTLEEKLVTKANLVICLSKHQTQQLSERYSVDGKKVRHFPLGVNEGFLNPAPEEQPKSDTVGYIGNLSDRVDWFLVEKVVKRCPDLSFVFVGRTQSEERGSWAKARKRVFSCDHVEHVGFVPQSEVVDYYWSFAVNWVPYDVEHPFNIAACPTKIMDSLGSGRPVVSTSTPEFTLYPEWVSIADTPSETVEVLHKQASRHNPSRNLDQVNFAEKHTWKQRAKQLLTWLD